MTLLSGAEAAPEPDREEAAQTAMAALLVEAAKADGVYLDAERETIVAVLAERFGLDQSAASAICEKGETAQAEAVDLVRFTRVIKDAVPFEDRVGVIEALWRVIYSDDDRDHRESALVRRLAGLLYVPDRDAGLARQRVIGER
ncbi:MAG: TerB family tellurite resistance protein [Pseudomonadota bacterium]